MDRALLNDYIRERLEFEIYIYDYLTSEQFIPDIDIDTYTDTFTFTDNTFIDIPDDFWDSVKINLSDDQIDQIPDISSIDICCICYEKNNDFKLLNSCCKNILCKKCSIKWFTESTKCPFCRFDLRN